MIPLYSLYTPSHAILKERFFVPSIPAGFDLRLHYLENPGAGLIHDPSFCRAIIRKVEVILQAIQENWGGVFVWSDVDAQFFRPFAELVLKSLENHDIVFQIDAPGPALCDGFFFCRANELTLALWNETLQFVQKPESRGDDQLCVRELVNRPGKLRVGFLPPTFMGGGSFTGRLWRPGDPLLVPEGIIVHHANFTCGVPNKVKQCELVLKKIADRDFISDQEAGKRAGVPWLLAEEQDLSRS